MWAIIKFDIVGVHYWPETSYLNETGVPYLTSVHRHVFKFEVWIEQRTNDRDIEYLSTQCVLEQTVRSVYGHTTNNEVTFGGESCEMIAMKLRNSLLLDQFKYNKVKVKVTEDGENGCMIE